MNPALANLQLYPFQRLAALKAGSEENTRYPEHIALSIGEPKHAPPDFIVAALADAGRVTQSLGKYPATKGDIELRAGISHWINSRFNAQLDPDTQILPVNGTREALFSFAQTILSGKPDSVALLPNPFYQIYEGAVLMRGTTPVFLPTTADNGYKPDFAAVPESTWQNCELVFICSPGNPSGAVMDAQELSALLELRDQYNFVIAADECYSEIYPPDACAPTGLLEVCAATGRTDFTGCMVFHSLSKRSNLPGLRSGFVAGDAELMAPYLNYRTYHGCAMPALTQYVSTLAWADEVHVSRNRAAYAEKFAAVLPILQSSLKVNQPQAAFYLWPQTPMDDQRFARELFEHSNVTVLPGTFLSRQGSDGTLPGAHHVRMALVAELDECIEAAERICEFLRVAS